MSHLIYPSDLIAIINIIFLHFILFVLYFSAIMGSTIFATKLRYPDDFLGFVQFLLFS